LTILEKKPKLAVIGGSGFEKLFSTCKQLPVETPYGLVSDLSAGTFCGCEVVFLSRHGIDHLIPPHKINYRANMWALGKLGVERIISINAVGAINSNFEFCDIVVPHDFVDFTRLRSTTFYDASPVTHIDMSVPYCPEIRKVVIEKLQSSNLRVWDKAVLICTEGPRFETPAEIEVFRRLGCDIVGMTGLPEAVLARELEVCYATVCFVSNLAAGMQQSISPLDASENSKLVSQRLGQALIDSIPALPLIRKCPCATALHDARFY
jgi:5'-methylthioadenosine phosphorylase